MDLEIINKEYVMLKKELETAKKETELLKNEVAKKSNEKKVFQATADIAKIDGDKAKEQTYLAAVKSVNDELKKLKKQAEDKQKKWEAVQNRVNEKIEEIKKEPGLKKHLDEVMAKKYDRELKRKKQTKEQLTGLAELAEKHKTVKNNLIGMTNAKKEINKLNKELDSLKQHVAGNLISYKDPNRANEILNKLIPEAKAKYDKNKDILVKYAKTQKVNIDDKTLSDITERLSLNKGQINITGTINKEIKGLDKQITDYTNALNNIDRESLTNAGVSKEVATGVKQGFFKRIASKFKNWNEKRKQKSLPEAETTSSESKTKKEKNEWSTSLKYDIVKDAVSDMEKQGIKDGEQQRKEKEEIER